MNRNTLVAFVLFLPVLTGTAANYTDPPGEPGSEAARMPALNEVEPRTLIRAIPFTITEPGNYAIVENLHGSAGSNGIVVSCSDVSIDLNGFALIGENSSLAGIYVSGSYDRLHVMNGRVLNWGDEGINASTAQYSRFENLVISTNGYARSKNGMRTGNRSAVLECTFVKNKFTGCMAASDCRIERSRSSHNTSFGFFGSENCTIQDSMASDNGAGGFRALESTVVTRCSAFRNGTDGFYLRRDCVVNLSTAATNGQHGFNISVGSVVADCTARGNTKNGFHLYGAMALDCASRLNGEDGFHGYTGYSSTIRNCLSQNNGGDGIDVNTGSRVVGCMVNTHTNAIQSGIRAGAYCQIVDNTCRNNFNGITEGGKALIQGNFVSQNTYGIQSGGTHSSLIIQNTATDNTAAQIQTTSDQYGPVLTPAGEITNSHPHANIVF